MAIQFPSPAYPGESFLAENGVEYFFDGVKWAGYASVVNPSTDHLHAGDVDLYLFANGIVQLPEQGDIVDANGQSVLAGMTASTGNYVFDGDIVNMPTSAKLNSGGVSNTGAAEIGAQVLFYSNQQPSNIVQHSEIYMGTGAGEFRSIYDNSNDVQNSLTYAGVEDTQNAYFSGVVSQTPSVYSQYAIALDANNNIMIGATQQDGALTSDDWATGLGTLNAGYMVNGIFANTTQTQINGGTATTKLNLSDSGLMVSTADGVNWAFGSDGTLTLPNGGSIVLQDQEGIDLVAPSSTNTNSYMAMTYAYTNWMYVDGEGAYIETSNGNSAKTWVFDNAGSLNLPHNLWTKTFSAVLLPVYGNAPDIGPYGGDAWALDVTFTADSSGVVSTTVAQIFPILNNPGYKTGDSWTFTTGGGSGRPGHGIPGYTLTITLDNVQYQGQAGWTADVQCSLPPASPSTINSLNAIKLTSNSNDWKFGTDGNLTLPAGGTINFADGSNAFNGGGSSLPVYNLSGNPGVLRVNGSGVVSWGYNDHWESSDNLIQMTGANCNVRFQKGASRFAELVVDNTTFDIQSVTNVKITSQLDNGRHDWMFSTNGNLVLPTGGYILNSDLSVYGNGANTADLAFVTGAMYRYAGVIVENADLSHAATGSLIIPGNHSGSDVQLNNSNGNVSIGTGNSINKNWIFNSNGNLVLPANSYILNSDLSIYGRSSTVPQGTQRVQLGSDLSVTIDNITGNVIHLVPLQSYSGTDTHAIVFTATPADGTRVIIVNDCPFINNINFSSITLQAMEPTTSRMELVYFYDSISESSIWTPVSYTVFSF